MTTSRRFNPTADLLRHVVICVGVGTLVAATTALAVPLTGHADDVRHALGFGFGGLPHTPAAAARILLHNARFAAGPLLCAAIQPGLPARTRAALDLLLGALLVLNAAAIGIALGAYGHRALTAIALHGMPELAALCLAASAYLQARKHAIPAASLAAIGALCALLLTGAAALEAYVSPGGGR
jgi:hypothetical protein